MEYVLKIKLFQWANSNCKETEILFSSKESYTIATKILKGRFDQAVTILGTLQYHVFISTQDRKLLMKKKNKIHQTHIQIIHPDKQKHHFPTHSITRYKFNRFNFQNIFQINLTLTVIQAL